MLQHQNVAVIHQPYLFPWLGYFNKLANATHWIVLDDAQYRARYYHNRSAIKQVNFDKQAWITLPTGRGIYKHPIHEIKILNQASIDVIDAVLQTNYARAPYFKSIWPRLFEVLHQSFPSLIRINVDSSLAVLKMLDIHPTIAYSSESICCTERTKKHLDLCMQHSCGSLILGPHSWEIHDLNLLQRNNIRLLKHDYLAVHPSYRQQGTKFISGLSILDCLFNIGIEQTRKFLFDSSSIIHKSSE